MPAFLTLVPLAMQRLFARWQLVLPLLIGAVLAVALLSSTFIYGDAVRQLGLEHAFDKASPRDLDMELLAYYAPTGTSPYATIRHEVEVAIDRNVDWFVDDARRGMKGSTFFVNQVGRSAAALDTSPEVMEANEEAATDPRQRATFFHLEDFLDRTTLVAGEQPPDLSVQTDSTGKPIGSHEVPAMVLEETAGQHGLSVGDRVLAVPHWEDVSPWTVIRVAGVVRPVDQNDKFWHLGFPAEFGGLHRQNFIPLYVSQETFLGGLGPLFPKMLADYSFSLFVDPERIDVRNSQLAEFGISRMNSQLRTRLSSYLARTHLDTVLTDFATRDLFGRIPLLIVVLMIMAIVCYYLVMVAGVVVDRHVGEIALMRSRGADIAQVLALYVWEAVIITVVAFIAGPLLAWGATSAMGYTAVFSDLTGGSALPGRLTAPAILMGLAGAAIAFLALLLPTIRAFSLNILRFKQSGGRPPAGSFFTRYYIDVFIGLIAGLLFWELTQRGSLVTTTLLGESSVDEVLLAAPALILLAVSLLFLRIFPYALQVMSAISSRLGSAWLALGLWQMGRNPMPFALPILLLMLASSVAMFAANFGATVDQSYEDRARYAAGSDVRLIGMTLNRRGDSESFSEAFGEVPRATGVSPAYRANTSPALQLFGRSRFQLLAVDPQTFRDVGWYRDDFSESSLGGVLAAIEEDTPPAAHGLAIPGGAESLGVWALPTTPRGDLSLRARIADVNGRYLDYTVGALDERDWTFLELTLPPFRESRFSRQIRLQPPLRLVSMTIRQRGGLSLDPGAVYLDDLQASVSGKAVLLETFDGPGTGRVIRDSQQAAADSLESSTSVVREPGGTSGVFIWGGGSLLSTRGLAFASVSEPGTPLAAVVSRSALENEGISIGDPLLLSIDGHMVSTRVAEVVDFFPTLDPYGGGFVVLNLAALMERLNTADNSIEEQPNEIWAAIPGGLGDSVTLPGVQNPTRQVVDRRELAGSFQADPLLAASWNGILRISYIAVVFSTLMGFAVYSYAQAQRRQLEFAMLRSIGLSRAGLVGTVMLEQMIVIVVGLALGSWLGVQLTSILLPFLGLNEAGTQILPPYDVRVSWTAILTAYGIMAVVFLFATVTLIGFFSRLAIQRVLRFGEV